MIGRRYDDYGRCGVGKNGWTISLSVPIGYIRVSLLFLTVPVLHSIQLLAIGVQFLLPLMGRIGTMVPPDLVLGFLFAAFTLLLLSYCGALLFYLDPQTLSRLRMLMLVGWIASLGIASHM